MPLPGYPPLGGLPGMAQSMPGAPGPIAPPGMPPGAPQGAPGATPMAPQMMDPRQVLAQLKQAQAQRMLLQRQIAQQQMLSQVGESGRPRYASYPPVGGAGMDQAPPPTPYRTS